MESGTFKTEMSLFSDNSIQLDPPTCNKEAIVDA